MKLGCPECGSQFSLAAGVADADARRFADLVAGLPQGVGKALIAYLALFRPRSKGLSWSRVLKLAQELEPQIRAAQVTRNGIDYAVPPARFAAAMQQLADRPEGLTLPLKSHGYLLSMLAGEAEKAAARAERESEQEKGYRYHRESSGGPVAAGDLLDTMHDRSGERRATADQPATRSPPPAGWKGPLGGAR